MWQQQVEVFVWGYGLEGFLTGEVVPPPQMLQDPAQGTVVPNPTFITWQRQDRRLAGWLLSSLSEGALVLVVGLRSTKDIWRALETNFASRSMAKVMQYRQQMRNQREDSLPMSEFLTKMRTCFDLLGSVGCRVSDGEQILHILAGLGQDYDPAVCSITSRYEPWTIADVCAFLLCFESRMEATRAHATSVEGSPPSLNLVQQSGQKKDGAPFNNKFEQNDGRGGSRNQRRGRGRGWGFGMSGKKIVCQLCDKPGHSAAKCWHRFEQNFTPPQAQMRPNQPSQQQTY